MSSVLLTHEVPGGAGWSVLVRSGRELVLTARAAGANCSTLVFAANDSLDRMNVPDTLKAQASACVRAPMVLMSDRGTALACVTESSLDWHDALCGHSLDSHVERFGRSDYAEHRNAWRRSARAALLSELAKHGRDESDLHACVNFFSKVAVADDEPGTLSFVSGYCAAGDCVTLRAEQDLLVVLSTSPHPLDPCWTPAPVLAEVRSGRPVPADDPSLIFRAESARAIEAARAVFA